MTEEPKSYAKRGALGRLLRSPFFWAAAAAAITLPLVRPLLRRVPDPPPRVGSLPSFELVDQAGRRFSDEDLAGNVYVVDFFFTTCQSICPRLTRAMKTLQDRFEHNRIPVRLLSITVDPENDTPEVLAAYAKKYGADTARWTFVTGTEVEVRHLIVEGFKTHMGQKEKIGDNLIDISHAGLFVIVDGESGIRGYYRPDQQGLDEMYHRSQHVLRQMEHGR